MGAFGATRQSASQFRLSPGQDYHSCGTTISLVIPVGASRPLAKIINPFRANGKGRDALVKRPALDSLAPAVIRGDRFSVLSAARVPAATLRANTCL